ncbi:hypothetical protein BMF77_03266 [Dolichospermum sp. UHCC 0315A]|jgi:hypothetical protein|uniref:hypothetical protein n=1 Tax=Dolichospermum sp. UHCC 0315A TaxID=1914871 RepID=UPI0011E62E64|nr:hypothetical protein [Dolichospermum sp. UHCC 0315A]QEI42655.1 hypothetical protein BMF77_03266 [Dolichospermum sp. UHCC 0315A]
MNDKISKEESEKLADSTLFVFEGSQDDFYQLMSLFEEEKLSELLGVTVLDLGRITESQLVTQPTVNLSQSIVEPQLVAQSTANSRQSINVQENTMNYKDSIMLRFESRDVWKFADKNQQNSSEVELFGQLFNIIYEQLQIAGLHKLLIKLQQQLSEKTKSSFLDVLELRIEEDQEFAKKLIVLFDQLEAVGLIQKPPSPSTTVYNTEVSFGKDMNITGGTVTFSNINQTGINKNNYD